MSWCGQESPSLQLPAALGLLQHQASPHMTALCVHFCLYVYKDTSHIGLGTSYRSQLPTVIISEDPVSKRDLSWGFSLHHMSLENTVWSLSQEKAGPRSPKVHNGELCKKSNDRVYSRTTICRMTTKMNWN